MLAFFHFRRVCTFVGWWASDFAWFGYGVVREGVWDFAFGAQKNHAERTVLLVVIRNVRQFQFGNLC